MPLRTVFSWRRIRLLLLALTLFGVGSLGGCTCARIVLSPDCNACPDRCVDVLGVFRCQCSNDSECPDGQRCQDEFGTRTFCKEVKPPIVCGNGKKEKGEACDDGNTVGGDGCSSTCQREACVVKEDFKYGLDKALWSLNGTAVFDEQRKVIIMTEPKPLQIATVWYKKPLKFCVADVGFSFLFNGLDTPGDADGFSLIFQGGTNDKAIGGEGSYLGAKGLTGISVRFNTYIVRPITVWANKSDKLLCQGAANTLYQRDVWTNIRVQLRGNQLSVFVNNKQELSCTIPAQFVPKSTGLVGFGASTGKYYSRQMIKDFSIKACSDCAN